MDLVWLSCGVVLECFWYSENPHFVAGRCGVEFRYESKAWGRVRRPPYMHIELFLVRALRQPCSKLKLQSGDLC